MLQPSDLEGDMKKRTVVLAAIVTIVVSGTGAFATTRYVKNSLALKKAPTNVADISTDIPHWSQADAARALKITDIK
jgi:hypothetical protein